VLLATLLLSMPARADAIGPPPEDCPSGSKGTSSHAGNWCAPLPCTDGVCGEGTTCETTGLCILREENRPCGGRPGPEPCTFTYQEAFGPCATDADCTRGTCVTDDYCVEAGLGGSWCSCASAGGASSVFLLGLLPLALRRRSR
jgi:hypothetical protein